MKLASVRHEVAESPLTLLEYVMEQGWGDGLPVIPPTEERVAAMVEASKRPPEESRGRIYVGHICPTYTNLPCQGIKATVPRSAFSTTPFGRDCI